jgi:hypothetical protein
MRLLRRKFLKELLESLQQDPSVTEVAKTIDAYLKKTDNAIKKYKKIVTWIGLAASILYNVLVSLGVW